MTKSKHLIFIASLIFTICSSGSAYAYDGYMRADIYCSEYSSIVKNDEQRLEGYLWYLTGFLVGLNFQRKQAGHERWMLKSEMNRLCKANRSIPWGMSCGAGRKSENQNSKVRQCDLGTSLNVDLLTPSIDHYSLNIKVSFSIEKPERRDK